MYGFGAGAHITAQLALACGAEVHVLTRDADARRRALELGAASARCAADTPPVKLDSAIVFAPAGELVPAALSALDQNGTVALAGIDMTHIPALRYQEHLFSERTLTSVTSNTRADGEELLRLATPAGHPPHDHALPDGVGRHRTPRPRSGPGAGRRVADQPPGPGAIIAWPI